MDSADSFSYTLQDGLKVLVKDLQMNLLKIPFHRNQGFEGFKICFFVDYWRS